LVKDEKNLSRMIENCIENSKKMEKMKNNLQKKIIGQRLTKKIVRIYNELL